ncbi:MAG: type I-U CRISPR-associated RAMP protein Csb1/Cas7u [Anaerolineales bacterium]|nr:type I-U CRISPR-associated RAMP protein Csb1/Cas7u [Anaerolineales bacterium]MDW8447026.1 type I-U CRISPR-associated RAMP protein Csb1/Cas7u [Anaerolineales bacterium]
MSEALSLEKLQQAVSGSAAAFRCRRRLQPAGGQGDKVFPPTFAGAVYAVEQRRIPGREQPVTCVLLDSVQSQANRMELALQEALDAGRIELPVLVVDFSAYGPTGDVEADKQAARLIDAIGKITSLQVPHRIADAILRDSQVNGTDFRRSEKGKALNTVSLANATPLFELCPTALLFGMWDSTGPKGGLGPKFERAIVSEIVGIGAQVGDLLRGVRKDPFEASNKIPIIKNSALDWKVSDDPKAKGIVAPSAVNHSSVPFPKVRDHKTEENHYSGVTIEYAEQVTTLSLICLRRLRFPLNGKADADIDVAARTVLAALGLCAATLAFESGMGLRSRCLLWPDGPMEWELLDQPGQVPVRYRLTSEEAITILKQAANLAKQKGLPWEKNPLPPLKPSPELLKLVRLSQIEATKEAAEA